MNMSFTFYHCINNNNENKATKQFVYECLKDQPIWRSLRFWTAAFFDAVQSERAKNLLPHFHQMNRMNKPLRMQTQAEIREENAFQENITFGQLGSVENHYSSFMVLTQVNVVLYPGIHFSCDIYPSCYSDTQNLHSQHARIWSFKATLPGLPAETVNDCKSTQR